MFRLYILNSNILIIESYHLLNIPLNINKVLAGDY